MTLFHFRSEDIKSPNSFFPTAQQVMSTDLATLKSAGLSTRKAEYGLLSSTPGDKALSKQALVSDLASRFADGRLSTQRLMEAEDEELYEMLTAVRGVGVVSSYSANVSLKLTVGNLVDR